VQLTGNLKSLKPAKQFGFVRHDKDEYFFHKEDFQGHWNDLCDDFESGKRIELYFEADRTPKGLRARNVSRTDHPNQAV
jgi:cold shock CspA family protein